MVPRSPCPPLSKESWLNQNLLPKEEGEADRVLSSVPVGHVVLGLWATPVAGASCPALSCGLTLQSAEALDAEKKLSPDSDPLEPQWTNRTPRPDLLCVWVSV